MTETQCVLDASLGMFTSPRVHFNGSLNRAMDVNIPSCLSMSIVNDTGVCFSGAARSRLDQSITLDITHYV